MYIYVIVLLRVKNMAYSYEYALQTIKSTVYEYVLYFTYVI
jgi:hypothetical protein